MTALLMAAQAAAILAAEEEVRAAGPINAWGFGVMLLSWAVIVALCVFCFYKLFREETAETHKPHEPTPDDSAI